MNILYCFPWAGGYSKNENIYEHMINKFEAVAYMQSLNYVVNEYRDCSYLLGLVLEGQ